MFLSKRAYIKIQITKKVHIFAQIIGAILPLNLINYNI